MKSLSKFWKIVNKSLWDFLKQRDGINCEKNLGTFLVSSLARPSLRIRGTTDLQTSQPHKVYHWSNIKISFVDNVWMYFYVVKLLLYKVNQ